MPDTLLTSVLVILVGCVVCLCAGWFYFGAIEIQRPPIGVMKRGDVLWIFVLIILIPLLYVALPTAVVLVIIVLGAVSLSYTTIEPLIRSTVLRWIVVLVLIAANLLSAAQLGVNHPASVLLNNLNFILTAVGIANLWAQTGFKARDAALLGALLVVYDFVATTLLSLMDDMLRRLSGLPFAPILAWGSGVSYAGVGLGDLLMATCFPLVMRKSYGDPAGWLALAMSLASIIFVFALQSLRTFPVMVVLGPVMVIQYLFWNHRRGVERTMREYRAARRLPEPANKL
jgi:hypothetical protein